MQQVLCNYVHLLDTRSTVCRGLVWSCGHAQCRAGCTVPSLSENRLWTRKKNVHHNCIQHRPLLSPYMYIWLLATQGMVSRSCYHMYSSTTGPYNRNLPEILSKSVSTLVMRGFRRLRDVSVTSDLRTSIILGNHWRSQIPRKFVRRRGSSWIRHNSANSYMYTQKEKW
jgi:hypothetical protein